MTKSQNFSLEILTHFHCQKCHRWWTVGDAPAEKQVWFCPWCGYKQNFVIKKSR